jgi:ABC-type Zn uptake system ZnuABC Zn-binding protein ZnuA
MVMSIDKLLEMAKKLEQNFQQNTAKILDDKKKIEQDLKSKLKR